MEIERKFQTMQLIASGGMSSIYQVDPEIVVKVPKNDEYSRQQFCKEIETYKVISQQGPCAFIVQCFYSTNEGIFLEYMRDGSLACRIQGNHTFDRDSGLVTHVDRIEPLHLRLAWMDDLTQAIAFLESFELAHGDLRPENLVLNRNRIKVTDFDNAAKFRTPFTVCQEPWGRELRKNEPHYDLPGCTAGLLGPRTEQFALGSIYYYINYGMEVYADKKLSARPRDRGLALRDLLKNMQFPVLSRDSMIDELIYKCWYNEFPTISCLSISTKGLFHDILSGEDRAVSAEMNSAFVTDKYHPFADSMYVRSQSDTVVPKELLCRELEEKGLFCFLRSNESC